MNIALWIIAGLLAAFFGVVGVRKLIQPRLQLATSGLAWVEDRTDAEVKGIGALEVLGAAGLILPAALGVAEILTPLAALGLAVIMAGAIVVHLHRKGENGFAVGNLVLGALALFVAVMRFGPYAF